jgi:alkylation response protein AidB-like acyl-CoA dehydrogenase
MDLSYSTEHEDFRRQTVAFIEANRHLAPRPGGPSALAWQALLIENGYAARTIPKAYGGYGAEPDILKSRIIAEEFARAQISPGMGGQGISMLVPTLLEMGTEEQKVQFIGPTLRGEMLWCQGYSEPNAGSDLASLATKGELVGEEWVINGQKIWTSTAHLAHWMFCLVRTEPDAAKHEGISFLLFSMETPGIEIRPLVDMTGAANFNEVFFTDVRVPQHQIVGRRGQGWQVANSILRHERGSLADPNTMLSRVNALADMMKSETLDGRPVMDNPIYRDRLVQIQGRVLAMRCNDLRLLSAAVNRQNPGVAAMVVKLQGTELRHELEALAIDVLGELGLLYGDTSRLRGHGSWQRDYMYFLGLIIGGGTSQIQKNIIAERGLGMPREAKLASA